MFGTHHSTVTVSPTLHTVCAVGFVMGGDTESRKMTASGVASAVATKAKRADRTCTIIESIAWYVQEVSA